LKKLVIFLKEPLVRQTAVENPAAPSPVFSLRVSVCAVLIKPVKKSNELSSDPVGFEKEQKVFFEEQSLESLLAKLEDLLKEEHFRTTLVIPAELSVEHLLTIPAKKASRQIKKALPYLLEDQIATEPESCFIALGEQEGDKLACSVIDLKLLSDYRDFLSALALNCDKIISEKDFLFAETESIHLIGDKVLLKTSPKENQACDLDVLDVFLEKFLDKEESKKNDDNEVKTSDELEGDDYLKKPLPVSVYRLDDTGDKLEALKSILDNFAANNDFPFQPEVNFKEIEQFYCEKAEAFSERRLDKRIINFLQGDFKVKTVKEHSFKLDLNWKPAAILLAVLFFISLFALIVDTKRYERASKVADEQSKQIFREIFPNTKNYSRMKSRVAALVKGGTPSDNQFLALMVYFSEAMGLLNDKKDKSIKATRFQYDQGQSILKVDVFATDFEILNQLKSTLQEKGLELEITSTSNEGSGVKSRLKVSLP
jgi:type II secretory pathway component PulL